MLSYKVLVRQHVVRLVEYYEGIIDDYYNKEADATGWQGNGADILGLKGTVDSEKFCELLIGKVSNDVPMSRKTTRNDSRKRLGIDLTFSAPKSVSLQALIYGDTRVIKAHDLAVASILKLAEKRSQARSRVHNKTIVEMTNNLIVAKFRHETSRECDPQLHTHAVVMNLTRRKDGLWCALRNDEIIKTTKYLGSAYRAELAYNLQKIGYQIRHERDGLFELAHISREQLMQFSKRSIQIEKKLIDSGLTLETASSLERYKATIASRTRKQGINRNKLYREWQEKARDIGIQFHLEEKGNLEKKKYDYILFSIPPMKAASRAVKYAVNHLTERQSVINERELIDIAIKHGMGAVRIQDIETELVKLIEVGSLIREEQRYKYVVEYGIDNVNLLTRNELIKGLVNKGYRHRKAKNYIKSAISNGSLVQCESRYTSQIALEREKNILKIERNGRGQVVPLVDIKEVREKLVKINNLNKDQCHAVEFMLSTKNRVIGVQGVAGTGKSHMFSIAKSMIKEQGYNVLALAPYGSQVKALHKMNINAITLTAFLLHAEKKDLGANTVMFIDEAGVVPTRIMEQMLKLVDQTGSRVVLMGDTVQTKAIEAGRPFGQLQAAGMETVHMHEIHRQKDIELKKAVKLAAQGNLDSSLQCIKNIVEIKEHRERYQAIADNYTKLNDKDRESTIILSGTNKARREINNIVRKEIGLAGHGIEYDILMRRDTTSAERLFSKNYHIGDIIYPDRDYKIGLKRGQLYKVVDIGPGNALTVQPDKGGKSIICNPQMHRKLFVYKMECIELSVGDKVRITRNNKKMDLVNGDRFEVHSVTETRVTLVNKNRTIDLMADRPLYLDYSYATTIHSSQGLTVDRVIIDADTESGTLAKDVYYVAISRARHEAKIYTNNIQKLPSAVVHERAKYAAMDLFHHRKSNELEKNNLETNLEKQDWQRYDKVAGE